MKTHRTSLVAILTLSLAVGLAASRAPADESVPPGLLPFPIPGAVPPKLSNPEVYERLLKSSVCIVQPPAEGNWYLGSGWIVDRERRLVVTNHHVVKLRDDVLVHFPLYQGGKLISERQRYLANVKQAVRGRVLDSDQERDLAVIQLESLPERMIALPFAADSPRQGEQLHQVGNPSGSEAFWVYTTGVVRQVYRRRIGYHDQTVEARVIESQCPSNPGDSGGPVVNDRGELVGTHTGSKTDSRLITWHIDVSEVRSYVNETRRLMTPVAAADFNSRGVRFLNRSKFDAALADFTAAIQNDDSVALYFQNRADTLLRKGDNDRALADAERAVKLAPTDARSLFMRGYAREMREEYTAALADYTMAVKLKGDYALAFEYRGDVHYKQGQADSALKDFSEAIRLTPENAETWQKRGNAFRQKKDYDKALADYERSLNLKPTASVFNLVGLCFDSKKEHDKAIACYTKALELDPQNATIRTNRADTWILLKQYGRAVADSTESIRIDPKGAYHWFTRGRAYEYLEDDAKFQADYTQAVQLDAAYDQRAPLYYRRYLRVLNKTSEVLEVHVQYETWTTKSEWQRFSAQWTFQPGEGAYLNHDNFKVNARHIRIWAKSPTGQYVTYKDKDLRIAPVSGYRAANSMTTFTFTFGK